MRPQDDTRRVRFRNRGASLGLKVSSVPDVISELEKRLPV